MAGSAASRMADMVALTRTFDFHAPWAPKALRRDRRATMAAARAAMIAEARESGLSAVAELIGADVTALQIPPRKSRHRDAVRGTVWHRGRVGEWDWFDGLSDSEQRRLRARWMAGNGIAPDLAHKAVVDYCGHDLTLDEAMEWVRHRTALADGWRSIRAGRYPSGCDLADLCPVMAHDGWDLDAILTGDETDLQQIGQERDSEPAAEPAHDWQDDLGEF